MITLEQYLGGLHLKYPLDYNPKVRANAEVLLKYVNDINDTLKLGIKEVRSGFRPPVYNKKVGGANRSKHITGEAIDVPDPHQELAKILTDDILEEFNLYIEHPDYTKGKNKNGGWIHFQAVPPKSGTRRFKP
jgi:hypothetical protein